LIVFNFLTLVTAIFLYLTTQEQVGISGDGVRVAREALQFQKESDSLNTIAQQETNDSSMAAMKQMVETNRISANAAMVSANASKRIANTTEQTFLLRRQYDSLNAVYQQRRDSINMRSFIVQNRAYLSIDTFRCVLFKNGEAFKTFISIANYGKTPAIECALTANAYISASTSFPTPRADSTEKAISIATLAAGQNAQAKLDTLLDTALLNLIKDNKRYIAWQGRITYTDIFRQKDTTTFALMYMPADSTFSYCDKFNEIK
jgi:hypothetical protein